MVDPETSELVEARPETEAERKEEQTDSLFTINITMKINKV